MEKIKWIKVVTDIFDDEKILLIESMPEHDAIIVIWFKLLCLAGKTNNSGVLIMGNIAYTDEMLSTIFRRPLNTVRLALNAFEKFGMIEIINNAITIPNWSKHQSLDAIEKKNEYMRKYMAEYREKQKLLTKNPNCKTNSKANVSCTDIDIDKDIDKDIKEKNIKKEKTFASLIAAYTSNDDLKSALTSFVEMRKKMKGYTPHALELGLKNLDKLAVNNDTKIAIVNQSIERSWKGFFGLKSESNDFLKREDEPF